MGDAQQGPDAQFFFAASLDRTVALEVTDTPSQIPDNEGALKPGRYLLHISDSEPSGNPPKVWIAMGKFEKGVALTVAPAVPHGPPFQDGRLLGIEVNVRKGLNDQIAGVTSNGSATLYITLISRDA